MDKDLQASIETQLRSHRVMSLGTLRPDGWPQVTMVGYVSEGLTLYFVIARSSQKHANISRDPRVSIAIGGDGAPVRGLSMAAHAAEVMDLDEVERVNQLVHERYPEASVFAPRSRSVAVMSARPTVISLIESDGQTRLVTLAPV